MLFTFDSNAVVHLISSLPTAKKRINARNKVKDMVCKSIDKEIETKRNTLRSMRSESESAKRGIYAEISNLENEKLKILAGEYGF